MLENSADDILNKIKKEKREKLRIKTLFNMLVESVTTSF